MNKYYEKSMNELKTYLKENKTIPSEKTWNRYALQKELLSSKSLEYLSNSRFNKMCRKLIKKSK